jgi:hypothetical protein
MRNARLMFLAEVHFQTIRVGPITVPRLRSSKG